MGCGASNQTSPSDSGTDSSRKNNGPCGEPGNACCAPPNECNPGTLCASGQCCTKPGIAGCVRDDDCCPNLTCESGKCCAKEQAPCQTSGDCCDGRTCVQGKCQLDATKCGSAKLPCCDKTCGRPELKCEQGTCCVGATMQCESSTTCCARFSCDVGAHRCCIAQNKFCADTTECCDGLACGPDGTCIKPTDPEHEGCGLKEGDACCIRKGTNESYCAAGLYCADKNPPVCQSCGERGEPCCDGKYECFKGLACDKEHGVCGAPYCGRVGKDPPDPCCPNDLCDDPEHYYCSPDKKCLPRPGAPAVEQGTEGHPCRSVENKTSTPEDERCNEGLVCWEDTNLCIPAPKDPDHGGTKTPTGRDCGGLFDKCCAQSSGALDNVDSSCDWGRCVGGICIPPNVLSLGLPGLVQCTSFSYPFSISSSLSYGGIECLPLSCCTHANHFPAACRGDANANIAASIARCVSDYNCCGNQKCNATLGTCQFVLEGAECIDDNDCDQQRGHRCIATGSHALGGYSRTCQKQGCLPLGTTNCAPDGSGPSACCSESIGARVCAKKAFSPLPISTHNVNTCCAPLGQSCKVGGVANTNACCGTLLCGASGTCEPRELGQPCVTNTDCREGECSKAGKCVTPGVCKQENTSCTFTDACGDYEQCGLSCVAEKSTGGGNGVIIIRPLLCLPTDTNCKCRSVKTLPLTTP